MAISSGPPFDSDTQNTGGPKKYKTASFLTTEQYFSIIRLSDLKEVLIADVVEKNMHGSNWLRSANEFELNDEYAARWLGGERWPAIILNWDLAIQDGHHRLHAAIKLGHTTIMAYVKHKPEFKTTIFPPPRFK